MPRPSLASVFAFRLACALAAAMAVYAVLEQRLNPGLAWSRLALEHGLHVVMLGFLVYVVLLDGLDRAVSRPLRIIHAHLSKVATGRLQLIQLASPAREIAAIEASVNLMVRRLQMGAGGFDPRSTAFALRDLGMRLHNPAPATSEALSNVAAALELLSVQLDRERLGGDESLGSGASSSKGGVVLLLRRNDSLTYSE